MTTILRPLSTSELLDRTFHLYRNKWGMFVGIAAVPQVGVFALRLTDSIWLRHLIVTRGVRIVLMYLATFVAIETSHAATAAAVSAVHLGRPTNIWSAYASTRSSLLRVIGIAFAAFVLPLILGICVGIVAIGVSLGSLAPFGVFGAVESEVWMRVAVVLVIFIAAPLLSIRWLTRWSLVVPVTVLEGGDLRTSLRRSRWLTDGHRWRISVIYLLVLGLTWAVTLLLQTPFYSMIQWRGFLEPSRITTFAVIVSAACNFVSQSLVAPLLTIAFTVIYYDERVRKEGFDLQLMMATLESAPQVPTALSTIF